MKEIKAAKENELANGEYKKITDNDTDILLARVDDKYYAIGATCPHYGGPLHEGVLSDGTVMCPWHHSLFDVRDGKALEPPSHDGVPSFDVKIENGEVIVMVPDDIPTGVEPEMKKHNKDVDNRLFVILGTGAAGYSAAQSLREHGYEGRLIMITREGDYPYDRPNLSKDYMQGEAKDEWIPIRSKEFYEKYDIDVMLKNRVVGIDFPNNNIIFDNEATLEYDKLLIATGGKPKSLDIPGYDLKNVHTLRSFNDADEIIESAEKSDKVAIIGGGFIGMETAHSLAERGKDITVITPEKVPFEKQFGEEVGRLFKKKHEQNGVKFKLKNSPGKFIGDGSVSAAVLENDEEIPADIVLMGVGVKPATDFISGLNLLPDGSIKVDEYFRVKENVFAAGDIVTFTDMRTGEDIRIEHWRTAEQQGRIAAINMTGKNHPNDLVPFFWTKQAGLNFQYVGHANDWDNIILKGDPESGDFMAFYVKGDQIHAVAANGHDRDMAAIEMLMRRKVMPPPEAVTKDTADFIALAKT